MTAKKSFFTVLRIFFLVFSLQFVKDAFYKWDGYSYYMKFTDFLPGVSLSFILWTIIGLLFAFVLWISIYIFIKVLPKSLAADRFEHIMMWFLLVAIIMCIKRTSFRSVSFSDLTGLGHLPTLIIGGVLLAGIIWIGHRYIKKILDEIIYRTTPVVWLFIFLLVVAIPLSFYKKQPAKAVYTPDNHASTITLEQKRPNIILVTWDTSS